MEFAIYFYGDFDFDVYTSLGTLWGFHQVDDLAIITETNYRVESTSKHDPSVIWNEIEEYKQWATYHPAQETLQSAVDFVLDFLSLKPEHKVELSDLKIATGVENA